MNRQRKFFPALVLAVAGVVLAGTVCMVPAPARAQSARAVGPTPPRLASIDGEVSFWRPGAEDWTPAQANTALAAGDSLYVGDGGNAEVEIGSRAYVRAGSGTQLAIASLETGYLQLEVTSGHCALELARLPQGQAIEVDSPSGAFTIERPGYYRVDVDDDTTFTTRNGGVATVVPAGGESTDIAPDQQVVLQGTDTATVSVHPAAALDDWDHWNVDRTGRHPERPRAAEYVPQPVAGIDDLDVAGDWSDTPDYGHVWTPRDVSADWAPYSTGRWVYDPYYEWTWVDDAPWGWAPYHYGRWCRVHDRWGWAPGPFIAAPVYSPALVTFFGGGGAVSVGIGAPLVSWVALGWGEPVLPWWGPVGFHGRPYWGGWGGPRVVNNVVINNTTIVNARNIDHFSNVNVRNAVVGVPRNDFGRGRIDHVRIPEDQARRLQPLRGSVGVRPVAASLVPNVGHAQRPPDRVQARRVVATRPPQDPTPRLRAAGIEQHGPMRRPEARVVAPTRGSHGHAQGAGAENGQPAQAGRPEQGGGPDRSGRPEPGGRMVAPPPPKHEGTVERGAPDHGRHGERSPASEGAAPNARDNRPDQGANHGRGPSSQEPHDGNVQGDRTPPVPKGERGRHVAPPPVPPTEHNPAPKGNRVNERSGGSIDGTRPEAPSRPQDAPVHGRGHPVTPHERPVPPPPPPATERPAERSAPPRGHSDQVAPPARGHSEQAAPPPRGHSEQAAPPPGGHSEQAAPPPRGHSERMAPPPREERVPPPARDHSPERVAPPARENAPPAREHAAPPARRPPAQQHERPAPPPPPAPVKPQAPPPAQPNGHHRDDAKHPDAHAQ